MRSSTPLRSGQFRFVWRYADQPHFWRTKTLRARSPQAAIDALATHLRSALGDAPLSSVIVDHAFVRGPDADQGGLGGNVPESLRVFDHPFVYEYAGMVFEPPPVVAA